MSISSDLALPSLQRAGTDAAADGSQLPSDHPTPRLTEAERHRLLVEWNDTRTEYPRDRCIHELFEAQAERTPEAVAVVYEDRQLTYRELNRRANQLAHCLRIVGVGPEVLVGICVERSLEMVVGLLGILKAGGAYVPLDPAYPPERLAFMLDDSEVGIILSYGLPAAGLPRGKRKVVALDRDSAAIAACSNANPNAGVAAHNLAYVMYTSGSTGRPKGVGVVHRGVVRLVKNTDYVELGQDEVFLQFAPLSFDASTFEIWAPLLNGGRLVVFPPGPASLAELGDCIEKQRVTTLWLTAGLFHALAEEGLDRLRGLRQLLVGGDVVSPRHAIHALRNSNFGGWSTVMAPRSVRRSVAATRCACRRTWASRWPSAARSPTRGSTSWTSPGKSSQSVCRANCTSAARGWPVVTSTVRT